MSRHDTGDSWRTPPAEGTRKEDLYYITWHPSRELTRKALFRLNEESAVLQHVRRIRNGRGNVANAEIDTEPDLEDVPASLRTLVEADGYRVENGGDAE